MLGSSCRNSLKRNITVIFTKGKALRPRRSTTPTNRLPTPVNTKLVINSLSPRQHDLSKPRSTSHGHSSAHAILARAQRITWKRVMEKVSSSRIESSKLWACQRTKVTLRFLRQLQKIPKDLEVLSSKTSRTSLFCLRPKTKTLQCWILKCLIEKAKKSTPATNL